MPEPESTPWAVICSMHGRMFLTKAQYDAQMNQPDLRWRCPCCGEDANWDDDNYEDGLEQARLDSEEGDDLLEWAAHQQVRQDREKTFKEALCILINTHSRENGSDTPDFIIAEYLYNCLKNFDATMQARKKWYDPGVIHLPKKPTSD